MACLMQTLLLVNTKNTTKIELEKAPTQQNITFATTETHHSCHCASGAAKYREQWSQSHCRDLGWLPAKLRTFSRVQKMCTSKTGPLERITRLLRQNSAYLATSRGLYFDRFTLLIGSATCDKVSQNAQPNSTLPMVST